MKILFLVHAFNSLTQRLYVELVQRGYILSVELDINEQTSLEAIKLFAPDVILAPYLKRAIPASIWQNTLCLIVHPGVPGDRGISSVDWAVLEGEEPWGVTVIEANGEMDGGDIWAYELFPMRQGSKSSVYRYEVTEAAVAAVLTALERVQSKNYQPAKQSLLTQNIVIRPAMTQHERQIDWRNDSTETIVRKINASDSRPGVRDHILTKEVLLFAACADHTLSGAPKQLIGKRDGAVCCGTIDGAVWIGQLQEYGISADPGSNRKPCKLPATEVLKPLLANVPELAIDPFQPLDTLTYREIICLEKNQVGYIHFDFYNGAMSVAQCQRLREVYERACQRGNKIVVLFGGSEFWSNGIHLNMIEAASSPADESWRNINAMNDLVLAIMKTTECLTISALQGNAGAGGAFLALASDRVVARTGVVLNPHYKAMGNLYGAEYWTYLLPLRVGQEYALKLINNKLPLGAEQAKQIGFIDDCFGLTKQEFVNAVIGYAEDLALTSDYADLLAQKRERLKRDEARFGEIRDKEMAEMRQNFYGYDPSYHVARYNFVYKVPHSRTPRHLARHRELR